MDKETQLSKLACFPVLASVDAAALVEMGFEMGVIDEVRAAAAPTSYANLGYNVVADKSLKNFSDNLIDLSNTFATNFSGSAVVAKRRNVRPTITVELEDDAGKEALINASKLSDAGGSKYGAVTVELQEAMWSEEISIGDIANGHEAEKLVSTCINVVARKCVEYALSGLTEAAFDVDGVAIAVPDSVEVPAYGKDAVGTPFCAGWANTELSEILQPYTDALLLDKGYYGAMKRSSTDDLRLGDLDFGVIKKVTGIAALGKNVVGVIAKKACMGIAMRAPLVLPDTYRHVSVVTHGTTKLPMVIVQHWDGDEGVLRIAAKTLIGRKRGHADAARLLVSAPAAVQA